ncbi:hypothetical protein [Hymenobacter cellulosivorans]|uniref:MoxR-vWA-beta-propeller ternary system domain-containing protein n=1 Tax=Hymenobacter cellulosivorans TaxID=2932249 RepID=A0ABY4F3H3_9BACT|nr:hypothetical protein [Hymenobacter cellulosivorans]UOQ51205.1 hypothetical protein MUN80_15695 [Hymenobacter cellulosivorans]
MAESAAGMMTERVLVLASADRAVLGYVRTVPGLRVAEAAGQLWVRGLPATGELPAAARRLPAAAAYALDAQNRLFATGQLTPTAHLPDLAWLPIQEFVPLELPTAALPGQARLRYRVRLVPSARAVAGSALLTTLAAWLAYVETAPEIRLRHLRFAVAEDERVLVLGAPLPPLAGQEYWLQEGMLLPAGFDFEAPLLAPLLARRLNPAADSLVVFVSNGRWEQVLTSNLVPATRSAVRRTAQSFSHA